VAVLGQGLERGECDDGGGGVGGYDKGANADTWR